MSFQDFCLFASVLGVAFGTVNLITGAVNTIVATLYYVAGAISDEDKEELEDGMDSPPFISPVFDHGLYILALAYLIYHCVTQ